MNRKTRRLLALTIILSTGIHQRLAYVKAQEVENLIQTSEVSSSIQSMKDSGSLIDATDLEKATDQIELLGEETEVESDVEQPLTEKLESTSSEKNQSDESNSIQDEPKTDTISKPKEVISTSIQMSDIQKGISEAIIQRVNDLRTLNNLKPLTSSVKLEEAANILVAKKPISKEFLEQNNWDAHNQDRDVAKAVKYKSAFVPANHLYTEFILKDLNDLDLKKFASNFVNKWYLDLADSSHRHRNQMLGEKWIETGVGVWIQPKVMVGDYRNEYIKSKFGDTLSSKTMVELLDGYDIFVTQYFGSGDLSEEKNTPEDMTPSNSKKTNKESVSLENYTEYVLSQIGLGEFNPQTKNYVELTEDMAYKEIKRQEKINNKYAIDYSGYVDSEIKLDGKFSPENIIKELTYFRDIITTNILPENISEQIMNKISKDDSGIEINVIEVLKEDRIFNNYKISKDSNNFSKLIPYSPVKMLSGEIDKDYSIIKENLFNDLQKAIDYGNEIIANLKDYYFSIAQMKDGQYSVWFTKKMIMREDTKAIIDHTKNDPFEDFLFDLQQIYIGIEKRLTEKSNDSQPVINEIPDNKQPASNLNTPVTTYANTQANDMITLPKAETARPFASVVIDTRGSYVIDLNSSVFSDNTPVLKSIHPIKILVDDTLELINLDVEKDTFVRELSDMLSGVTYEYIAVPWNSKYLKQFDKNNDGWVAFNRYVDFGNETINYSNTYQEAEKKGASIAKSGEKVLVSRTAQGYYFIVVPEEVYSSNFNTIDDLKIGYKTLGDTKQFNVNPSPELGGYTIEITRPRLSNEPLWAEEDKQNVYIYNSLDELKTDLSLYASHFGQRYDIYELGGKYAVAFEALATQNPDNEKVFKSIEMAQNKAKEFLAKNPGYFYDIFQVDDVFVVRYGESRLETRWNPDAFYFRNKQDADHFAQFVASQVRSYEYSIVPDRNGYYKIDTEKIIFHDDQDGLVLLAAYLASGNSGILGQDSVHDSYQDIYEDLRRKNLVVINPSLDDFDIWYEPTTLDFDWTYVPTVYAEDKSQTTDTLGQTLTPISAQNEITRNLGLLGTVAQTAPQDAMMKRIRLVLTDVNLSQWINYVLVNLFGEDQTGYEAFKEKYDLFYQLEVLFKDSTQETFAEPLKVELVLLPGEEVDTVIEHDITTLEEKGTIGFQVEERTLDQVLADFPDMHNALTGQEKVKVLTFELKQASNFAIKLKK